MLKTTQNNLNKPMSTVFIETRRETTVVDGEVVVVLSDGLDFDALSQRIHPAESRVTVLAGATPATLVAFDLLARKLTAGRWSWRGLLVLPAAGLAAACFAGNASASMSSSLPVPGRSAAAAPRSGCARARRPSARPRPA